MRAVCMVMMTRSGGRCRLDEGEGVAARSRVFRQGAWCGVQGALDAAHCLARLSPCRCALAGGCARRVQRVYLRGRALRGEGEGEEDRGK